ncbi:unnamed protein product [Heterobilharzia americana]|nr:unnamed protein product [Heterobilharzia americana]
MNRLRVILVNQVLTLTEFTPQLPLFFTILLLQISVVSNSTIKHYLLIHGPMHSHALINTTVQLKCRVHLLIQNTSNLEDIYSESIPYSHLNDIQLRTSTLSSTPSIWQVINPNLLTNKLKIIVQWMKDGFGYDRDTLKETFNGRYTMIESKEKDVYDLIITNIQYEDEGEYACQARLVEKLDLYKAVFRQLTNQTKRQEKSMNSDLDSSMSNPLALPMSLIKSNTAYLNVIVPPKSINLSILSYRNSIFQYSINNKDQLNHFKSIPLTMINTNNQSIWLSLNQSIVLICSTTVMSKPLGKLIWSVNKKNILFNNKDYSSMKYTSSSYLKEKSIFNQLNENMKHELFNWLRSWSILNLTFHGTEADSIPVMCSLDNLNDYMAKGINASDNPNTNQTISTTNYQQISQPPVFQSITINLMYITNVYVKIYSLLDMVNSSTETTGVLIENQPVQLGCFYEKSNAPADATYEYTFFIQSKKNSILLEVNPFQMNRYSNDQSQSSISNSLTSLVQWSKYHFIEFLPDRKFHDTRVYCQISIKQSRQMENNKNSLVISPESFLLSNERYQKDIQVVSSKGYIDLTVYYGPQIKNPEDQFFLVYPCTTSHHELRNSCSSGLRKQNITLWCQTDFNPPGRVEWFQWRLNDSLLYITNGQSFQLNTEQLQTILNPVEINSNNLWIIDKYFMENVSSYDKQFTTSEYFHLKFWKFTCTAVNSIGFYNHSANRFIIQADKPFLYTRLKVYGLLGKSINLVCYIISFPKPNFIYSIWSYNGKYITNEKWSNHNKPIVLNSSKWYSDISTFNVPNSHFKYSINTKKYSFGLISTLRVNNLSESDEGNYECSMTNIIGTSSSMITLKLHNKYTSNRFIQTLSICLLFVVILPLAVIIILLYIRRTNGHFRQYNKFCTRFRLKSNRKMCKTNQKGGYNQKFVDSNLNGYCMGVDFSELIQNLLTDGVNNSSQSHQPLNQLMTVDHMIPLHQNYYIHCCILQNNCQHHSSDINIPPGSHCLTCPYSKMIIVDNTNVIHYNNQNNKNMCLHDSCHSKQITFHPEIKEEEFSSIIPCCLTKIMHNTLKYEPILYLGNDTIITNTTNNNNSNHEMTRLKKPSIFSSVQINNNNTSVEEFPLNSMINQGEKWCREYRIENDSVSHQYFTLPHHYSLHMDDFMNSNNNHNNNCQNGSRDHVYSTLKWKNQNFHLH